MVAMSVQLRILEFVIVGYLVLFSKSKTTLAWYTSHDDPVDVTCGAVLTEISSMIWVPPLVMMLKPASTMQPVQVGTEFRLVSLWIEK